MGSSPVPQLLFARQSGFGVVHCVPLLVAGAQMPRRRCQSWPGAVPVQEAGTEARRWFVRSQDRPRCSAKRWEVTHQRRAANTVRFHAAGQCFTDTAAASSNHGYLLFEPLSTSKYAVVCFAISHGGSSTYVNSSRQ
jgi:hypothetical protein